MVLGPTTAKCSCMHHSLIGEVTCTMVLGPSVTTNTSSQTCTEYYHSLVGEVTKVTMVLGPSVTAKCSDMHRILRLTCW